jgi:predicted lipoprotein with Yx(FWY)xxD motif
MLALGALFALVGCGGTSSPSGNAHTASTSTPAPTKAAATLSVRSVAPLGQLLADGSGRTLYLFEADTSNKSTCSGACAQGWPPFVTTGAPQLGAGVNQALVGTTTRSDGSLQVTYNGHPLYYFSGDTQAGNAKGENIHAFGADWYVVSPVGDKIEPPGS